MKHVTIALALALCLAACKDESTKTPEPAAQKPATKPAAKPPVAPPAPAPLPECTITTDLKPGVPGSPGHLIDSPINPNGDSELSDLMRTMLDDARAAREAVLAGTPIPKMAAVHRRVRCTWPTDPATRNGHFDSMSKRYLDAVTNLEKTATKRAYGEVVEACLHCHENTCPGPTVAIRKLRLDP